MEKPLLEIKKEPSDCPSTNLLDVEVKDECLILNNSEDLGSKQIIAAKQADRKRLEENLFGIYVDPNSVCKLCVKIFLSPNDLEIHRQRVHHKELDQLSKCHKTTSSNQIINDGDYLYYCNLCSYNSDLLSRCIDHIKSHCALNVSVISVLKDALYIYDYCDKSFHCKLCEFKCNEQLAIIMHVNGFHLDVKHQECASCGETFDNLAILDNHKCTHTSEKPYKCTNSYSVFNDLNSTDLSEVIKQEEYLILDDPEIEVKESSSLLGLLKQPEEQFEEIKDNAYYVILNKIYRCTICPFGAKDLREIKSHFETHNISTVREASYIEVGDKLYNNLKDYLYEFCDTYYRCKVCEFTSSDHESIKQHVDNFHINATSQCEVCTKFFASSSVLKVLNLGAITSQYKCLKCEYTSFEPLTKHMESHPNKCSECDVISSKPLPKQMEDSTTDTMYYCNLCGCKCETRNSWNYHTKHHLDAIPRAIFISKNAQYVYDHLGKRFQCNLCKYNSSNHKTMKVHIQAVHLNIRHRQCKLCGKRFYSKGARGKTWCQKCLE